MVNSGIVLMDKPVGLSSAQALAKLKRQLGTKKIGHAGTLDPFATGLLICLTEGATRLASFAQAGMKTYSGVIRFGLTTSSDDITGEPISLSEQLPDFATAQRASEQFVGVISQVPPQVSAIKVEGERAYKRARQGLSTKLAPREVQIYSFDIEPLEGLERISFRVTCSSGTYIRALARDLGAALECGACLEELRREASEPFSVQGVKELVELTVADIVPWYSLFPETKRIELDNAQLPKIRSGLQREITGLLDACPSIGGEQKVILLSSHEEPCGFLHCTANGWQFGGLIN